jgi:hypothetical protein
MIAASSSVVIRPISAPSPITGSDLRYERDRLRMARKSPLLRASSSFGAASLIWVGRSPRWWRRVEDDDLAHRVGCQFVGAVGEVEGALAGPEPRGHSSLPHCARSPQLHHDQSDPAVRVLDQPRGALQIHRVGAHQGDRRVPGGLLIHRCTQERRAGARHAQRHERGRHGSLERLRACRVLSAHEPTVARNLFRAGYGRVAGESQMGLGAEIAAHSVFRAAHRR